MTISVAQGYFTIASTLTVGQTIDVTTDGAGNALTGFHTAAARVVKFAWSGQGNLQSSGINSRLGIGFATGTAARRVYASASANGAADSRCFRQGRDDACILRINSTDGTVAGQADYNGQVTNGFQVMVDVQFGANMIVSWEATWGDELEVAIHDFTSPATASNVDYNVGLALDTGLSNKSVFIIGGTNAAFGTTADDSNVMIGAAAGDTPSNAVLLQVGKDGLPDTATFGYCLGGECLANSIATDTINERARVPSSSGWNSTGFRLEWLEVNGTEGLLRYSALVCKGPQYAVGDILSRTDTTQTDETVGFQPLGLELYSHSNAQSTSNVSDANACASIGFATASNSRSVACVFDHDAQLTSNVEVSQLSDAMYAAYTSGAVQTGLMDLVDMSASGGGFTFVMDVAEGAAAYIWYLATGEALTTSMGSALHDTAYFYGAMIEE